MRRATACLLLLLLLPSCQRTPMVIPGMFANGRIDPLRDVPEAERSNNQNVFFVTDRLYETDTHNVAKYGRQRSDWLDIGQAIVRFGPDDAWARITAATRNQPGGERFHPQITSLVRFGELDTPGAGPVNPQDAAEDGPGQNDATKFFINRLDAALTRPDASGRPATRDLTIYIHGFNNSFGEAVLTTAEYDLYTGGLGPFILYSWPSYDSMWEYSHDRDSVRFTAAHARRFMEFLADEIRAKRLHADKINIIAHSTGAEVIGSVLREAALMSRGMPPEDRAAYWRIGTVILIAPDVSTDVARERLLKEDLRGMYDEMVVYSSLHDRALDWAARMLYRTPRIGSIREEDLTDADKYWLNQAANVALVDIDSQPYNGLVNHSHHRFSPAVSSDIILTLRSGLPPAQRGLVRADGEVLWRFADDYEKRVTEAAKKAYGQVTGQ